MSNTSDSLPFVTFGDTLLATLVGALAGALVGAFAAWMFSLDLRRREREDRAQEREQDRLDRIAEREQERLTREAEREKDREQRLADRAQDRHLKYDHWMLQQWPRVADAMRTYANANRAVFDAVRTDSPAGDEFARYRRAVVSLMNCLHEVATTAEDSDHEIVNNIGVLTAIGVPYSEKHITEMDRVQIMLTIYMTAKADDRSASKQRLQELLWSLVSDGEPTSIPR